MTALAAELHTDATNIVRFPRRSCETADRCRPDLSSAERDRLNRLRWLSLKSRLQPRPDVERACYLLAGREARDIEMVANAFFRGLVAHGSRPIELYRPGTPHPSPDEIWLLRLLAAFEGGTSSDAAALVAWRIRPQGRRWMRFLAAALEEVLQGTDAGGPPLRRRAGQRT